MSDQTPAERVARYLTGLSLMRGIDPEDIHGLHLGSDREAVLTVSDLSALLAQREALLEALKALVIAHIGRLAAIDVEANGWAWPENLPPPYSPAVPQALAAISLATSDDPPRPPAIG